MNYLKAFVLSLPIGVLIDRLLNIAYPDGAGGVPLVIHFVAGCCLFYSSLLIVKRFKL